MDNQAELGSCENSREMYVQDNNKDRVALKIFGAIRGEGFLDQQMVTSLNAFV